MGLWLLSTTLSKRLHNDLGEISEEYSHEENREEDEFSRKGFWPAGGFRIEGVNMPRSGPWELYLDITRAAITERAQVDLQVK